MTEMQEEIIIKLSTCKTHLYLLKTNIQKEDNVKLWFQQLCNSLADVFYDITIHIKNEKAKFNKGAKNVILLYLTQLTSSLSLLIEIFIRESAVSIIITGARNYVIKQIVWCLNGLRETLRNHRNKLDAPGTFIKCMDKVLDQIAEIDLNKLISQNIITYEKAVNTAEEILSHAMSIAQLALIEDCKIIKGSSQAALEALDCLKKELLKTMPNEAMINLFIYCCNDKFYNLEKKINEAVLKLCFKLFANYVQPLNKLHEACLDSNDEEKLDGLIADFDTHVDQIMQVANFAISCTTNSTLSVKMKSCLESLEALEVEIVPAFNALFKEKSAHNENFSYLLKNYWLHQADSLKNLLYLVIDPFAFTLVAYENIESEISTIVDVSEKNGSVNCRTINDIVSMGLVLDEMLNVVLADVQPSYMSDLLKQLKAFKDVLYEVKIASTVLLKEKESLGKESNLRIIKRLKVLLTVHKKLLYVLMEDCDDSEIEQKKNSSKKSPSKSFHLSYFNQLSEKEEGTIDLQITEILKELTCLRSFKS